MYRRKLRIKFFGGVGRAPLKVGDRVHGFGQDLGALLVELHLVPMHARLVLRGRDGVQVRVLHGWAGVGGAGRHLLHDTIYLIINGRRYFVAALCLLSG